MSNPEELAPFPPFPPEKPEGSIAAESSSPLTPDEIRDLRLLLERFRQGTPLPPPVPLGGKHDADPFSGPPPSGLQGTKEPAEALPLTNLVRDAMLRGFEVPPPAPFWEVEAGKAFREILMKIADEYQMVQVYGAIKTVFPMRNFLRFGAPEQKLFALNLLGDRFLGEMAGVVFAARKDLLKVVARYFSECSDGFSFIPMEGEVFNPQFHERMEGSSASGRTVKEMRGFVVTRKNSDQIVRLGRVFT